MTIIVNFSPILPARRRSHSLKDKIAVEYHVNGEIRRVFVKIMINREIFIQCKRNKVKVLSAPAMTFRRCFPTIQDDHPIMVIETVSASDALMEVLLHEIAEKVTHLYLGISPSIIVSLFKHDTENAWEKLHENKEGIWHFNGLLRGRMIA